MAIVAAILMRHVQTDSESRQEKREPEESGTGNAGVGMTQELAATGSAKS